MWPLQKRGLPSEKNKDKRTVSQKVSSVAITWQVHEDGSVEVIPLESVFGFIFHAFRKAYVWTEGNQLWFEGLPLLLLP